MNDQLKSDAQRLGQQPAIIMVAGAEVSLKPMNFGECMTALAMCEPLADAAARNGSDIQLDLGALLRTGGRVVVELAAHMARLPVLFVTNLDRAEGSRLLGAFIEANADFFIEEVFVPAMSRRRHAVGSPSLSSEMSQTMPAAVASAISESSVA